ncbi:MAG: uracil-xanthine permease [Clostridia bacterium]|nr:uracil-xanthine permease [Clostridia bacterium]
MKLIYNVDAKPKQMGYWNTVIFAIQQLLAIMAATLVVPVIINSNMLNMGNESPAMSSAAALFGAGVGTLVYLLFTRRKSPVFLGSSFAFIGSMTAAFAGAATIGLGYLGLILGAAVAGLVYVIIAIIVKLCGVAWINKIMPTVVIGPTVTIIGLSLAGNAVGDMTKSGTGTASPYICLICALVTLAVTMFCSVYGSKKVRLIPFIIGVLAGYAMAAIYTTMGILFDDPTLMVIDFSKITSLWANGIGLHTFFDVDPHKFTFVNALGGFKDFNLSYLITVIIAYAPVAFVVFAEHIADHKNLSTIIEKDLLVEPGLSNTLLGDGIGSVAGAFFGGCPNTTYGESVGCVAISGNASVWTIIYTAIGAILISFLAPFVAFVNSIPSCVMGGICVALYGFIAVSGLKMVQKVDLSQNKNLFTVSVILITGVGGLVLTFGQVTLTTTACALILGILTNLMLKHANETED